MLSKNKSPKVFISYSWEDGEHQKWVRKLATKLRKHRIAATLDQWDAVPGDRLPKFMETSITKHDYVLVICTPTYKKKSDGRKGGVGYEGDIITGELLKKRNHRKFIPLLRKGDEQSSLPIWLLGTKYIDIRDGIFDKKLDELIALLFGRKKIPATRPVKPYLPIYQTSKSWVLTLSSGAGYKNQILLKSKEFPSTTIEQKNKTGYHITSLSYGEGAWNVIFSKSDKSVNQIICFSKSFPYKAIENNARKGFKIICLSHGQGHWAVVLSKGERHIKQSWHIRDGFPKRLIDKKWGEKHSITFLCKLNGKWVLVTTKGSNHSDCGYQNSSTLPRDYIEKKDREDGCCITSLTYGGGSWTVVVAKDTDYVEQLVEITASLSQGFINKYLREGFFVTGFTYGPVKSSA